MSIVNKVCKNKLIVGGNDNNRILSAGNNSNIVFLKNIINQKTPIPIPIPIKDPFVFTNEPFISLTKAMDGEFLMINNEQLIVPTTLLLDNSLNQGIDTIAITAEINSSKQSVIIQNNTLQVVSFSLINKATLNDVVINPQEKLDIGKTGQAGSIFLILFEPGGIAGIDASAIYLSLDDPLPIIVEEPQVTLSSSYNNNSISMINSDENEFINVVFDSSFSENPVNIIVDFNTVSQIIIFTNNTNKPVNIDLNVDVNSEVYNLKETLTTDFPGKTISFIYPLVATLNLESNPNGQSIDITGTFIADQQDQFVGSVVQVGSAKFENSFNVFNSTNDPTTIIIPPIINYNNYIRSSFYILNVNKLLRLQNGTGMSAILTIQLSSGQINNPIVFSAGQIIDLSNGSIIKLGIFYNDNQININAYVL